MNRKCYKSVISEGLEERLRLECLARRALSDDLGAEKLRHVRSDLLDRLLK
jgi:hypothetical protein